MIFFTLFMLSMLTLTFGTLSLGQYAAIKALKYKLAKLSATDDEIMCILEATDSPLAKKLLTFATAPPPALAPPQLSAPASTPKKKAAPRTKPAVYLDGRLRFGWSDAAWAPVLEEFRLSDFDKGRISLLESWLRKGYVFSAQQRLDVMRSMSFDMGRDEARKVIDDFERSGFTR